MPAKGFIQGWCAYWLVVFLLECVALRYSFARVFPDGIVRFGGGPNSGSGGA